MDAEGKSNPAAEVIDVVSATASTTAVGDSAIASNLDSYLYVLDDEYIVARASASSPANLPSFNGTDLGLRLPAEAAAGAAAGAAAATEGEENVTTVQLPDLGSDRYRWVRNCSSAMDNVDFEDPRVVGSLIPLGIICLVVVFGNAMVIAAVQMTRKLRGATNLFIVSLAWADLMLGVVVLPSSATYEVFGLWLFGDVWCAIWLAVDVWTCTASILHLVVISLDRFIAVTHPVTYPNLMTTFRAKLLVVFAWVMSFFVCFPPLVGWNSGADSALLAVLTGGGDKYKSERNMTLTISPGVLAPNKRALEAMQERCNPQCMLSEDLGYVLYSAVGSFYAPMLVMMYFNFRIYRTATNTTKAIRQGFTKVKGAGGADGQLSMGIHRGGGATAMALANSAASTMSVPTASGHRLTSPRKGSASISGRMGGGGHLLASSRRTSATCLAVNGGAGAAGLRRQQTIAIDSTSSRSLPRSVVSSTSSKTAANGKAGGAGGASGASGARQRRCSNVDANYLTAPSFLSPHRNGSPGSSRQRHLSSSTNSLHVPPNDFESRGLSHSTSTSSGLGRRRGSSAQQQPSPQQQQQQQPEQKQKQLKKEKNQEEEEKRALLSPRPKAKQQQQQQSRPRMSQHQPCPNHIMGKTFAEQGTQTTKDERMMAASASTKAKKKKGRGKEQQQHGRRIVFRWRSTQAGSSSEGGGAGAGTGEGRSGSPCNMVQLAAKNEERRRRRLSLHSCFHFTRWKLMVTGRGGASRRSANSGSSGVESGGEGGGGGGASGVASGLTSGAPSQSDLCSVRLNPPDSSSAQQQAHNKFGKRNIKSQVRRFRMETKAAKTLGIIVGCFICCWFPFFTSYLIRAFCTDCIPAILFSVIFWLGYCNSAINPFIYAMFSRDFRNAFKRILCRFLCQRQRDPYGHVGALARLGLPFAPQTVAIGLADRFPPGGLPQPGQPPPMPPPSASQTADNNSTSSSTRTQRKNSLYP